MSKSQKALAKQKAKRAQHNKDLRLKREKEAVARRGAQKQISSINDFAKHFVADSVAIITKRTQFIADIKAVIKRIEMLRATEPTKYQNLSTDKFTTVLNKLTADNDAFTKLADVAAQMEDAKDAREKARICMENLDALVDAQGNLSELVAEIVAADEDFRHTTESPEKAQTKTLDTPDVVEYEERSMEDGEVDVPADAKLGS